MKLRFWAVFKPEMTLSLLHIVNNTSKYTFLPQSQKPAADQMSSLLPVCNGQNIHKYPVYHKTAATASHWRDNYIHAGMNHPYMYIVPT